MTRPVPIRTTPDNAFAHTTMTTRLPRNIRNIIAGHPHWDASVLSELEALAQQIESDGPIPPLPLPAWDADRWEAAREPYRGATWHEVDWFFGETYGFRLILSATRYFETGHDPFGPLKQRELDSGAALEPLLRAEAEPREGADALEAALDLATWGNRADISFVAGGDLDAAHGERSLLLVDDAPRVLELAERGLGEVHIIMDNSGAELAGDLVLASTLMRVHHARVVLHPKFYPTYVSDTTPADIDTFLRMLASGSETGARAAGELRRAFATGDLRLAPDPFWCETGFMTDMPLHISRLLAGADLIIVKGDFNYRRAMRDTIWTPEVPAAAAMGLAEAPRAEVAELARIPWLLLRTMKSDCLAGVGAATVADLDREAPGWRTDGVRALMQLV